MQAAWRQAWKQDRVLKLSLLALFAVMALYLVPPWAGVEIMDWYQGLAPALLITLWALLDRLRKIPRATERRFWELLSLAYASWLLAQLTQLFFSPSHRIAGFLLEDVCLLGFYLFFLFAIESHPHRVIPREYAKTWQARKRFELEGALLFAAGLLIYFVFIPALVIVGEYVSFSTSGWLYVALDLLIIARTLYARRIAHGRRWPSIYGILLVTSTVTLLADIFDTLTYSPTDWFYTAEQIPPALYTLWYLYLVPTILAARLRRFLPSGAATATTDESLTRERLSHPFSNVLLLYASLLPVLHLLFQSLEILDTVADPQRSLTALFYILAFSVVIRRQQKYEEGRSRLLEIERRKSQERERLIAELEARSAEMERFTYTVSHDLKSPIITIQGFLGMLEKDSAAGDADRVQADVQKIRSAAARMGRTVEELLELARIGRIVNEPREVPVGELAREATELVAGQIRERGVKVDIDSDLPVVFGDRTRLLQVFQNLIDNAVKFMGEQRRPRIEISARQDETEAVYYVRDNGVGIDPRFHDQVFGLFDRLQADRTGSGIGLALVKRIIEVHGGRIWVESEGDGKGCAMCFTLPQYQGS